VACFDVEPPATTAANGLPVSGAVDLYFYQIAPLTQV
jgi:hypothetical protein